MIEKSKKVIQYMIIGISILGLLAMLLVLGPWIVRRLIGIPDYLQNNNQLDLFASNVYDYPLPPNTVIIDTSSRVELQGNGNHCDFVVEVKLETSLSMSEIMDYYSSVNFHPVRTEYQGANDMHSSGIHKLVKPRLELLKTGNNESKLIVLLRVVDFGYPPGFDFRCN